MTARRRLLAGVVIGAGLAVQVQAEAVESHPAPILQGAAVARLDARALLQGSEDATPFGVLLAGVTVVDARAAVAARGGLGIDTSAAGAMAHGRGFDAALQPFLGQPLSYALISRIEAAITQYYRDHGRSLVLVSVPPQEITSGILRVQVNTFRLEGAPVLAGDPADEDYVQSQIRAEPGQEVDTAALMADVGWLNLNPFRRISVAFQPGRQADGTHLTLQVQSRRPWSAYLGASNAGSEDTGVARVFAGFNLGALPWQDQQLSWQSNASPGLGGLWDTEGTKGYVSHALAWFAPLTLGKGLRVKLTAGLNHVSSFAVPVGVFSTGTTTEGQSLELAFPLPRRSGGWSVQPELVFGLGHDDYTRRQYFGSLLFDTEKTGLTHLDLGLRGSLNGHLAGLATHGDFDIGIKLSRQEGEDAAESHGLIHASLGQEITLGGDRALSLRLAGQKARGAGLHALEQLGLGGEGTVRGYGANAVSGDSGASLSVGWRLAPVTVPMGARQGRLVPGLFADWGVVSATDGAQGAHLASVGGTLDFTLGEAMEAGMSLSRPLISAGGAKAGDTVLALRLVARF